MSMHQVWLVFESQASGDEDLLGAFSAEEKASAKVYAVARERGWIAAYDEEGRPCVRRPEGGLHVKVLEVE